MNPKRSEACFDLLRLLAPTNRIKYTLLLLTFPIKIHLSAVFSTKLKRFKNVLNSLFQHLGACFNPYRAFTSLHITGLCSFFTSTHSGTLIYTSLSNTPYRNALFTSNCAISRSSYVTIAKNTRIESYLTTGANVSK